MKWGVWQGGGRKVKNFVNEGGKRFDKGSVWGCEGCLKVGLTMYAPVYVDCVR